MSNKDADVVVSENGILVLYIHQDEEKRLIDELKKLGLDFEIKVIYCG